MRNTLEKDHTERRRRRVHRHLPQAAPGRAADARLRARSLLENLFFNPKRYDMAKVGRHKVSKKLRDEYAQARALKRLDLTIPNADPDDGPGRLHSCRRPTSSPTVSYLVKLHNNDRRSYFPDDIDHFGNRRVRSVGELIQNQVRVGLSPHGAGRARAHDHPGRRGDHAADADQHPPGGRGDQGVLRLQPAQPVHGPDQPARGPHAQAPPLGPRPGRSVA